MKTSTLVLAGHGQELPELEASLALASEIRLSLQAGPLRLHLPLEPEGARALRSGGSAFPVGPGGDPVFLQGEGILNLKEARIEPGEDGDFLLEASGTAGWGPGARYWSFRAHGRVDLLEVEHKTEKAARQRLAEILPAPPTEVWGLHGEEVPELGLWRLEVERLQD